MRFRVILLILILLTFSTSVYAQTGVEVPELSAVDDAILAYMDAVNVPGISVAITKDGRLVYARGFGYADLENGIEVQPYHRFRIASLTKPITSAAVLILMEQGLLGLDDTVFGQEGILNDPEYQDILDPRVLDITIRDLLQHTGGWDRDISGNLTFMNLSIAQEMNVEPPADAKTIIRYVLSRKLLDFDPSTRYAYCNLGYSILGRVIEKLTGLTYEQYVNEAVLEPAGAPAFQIGRTLFDQAADKEVQYYESNYPRYTNSVYGNGSSVRMPYGSFYMEANDSCWGWITSAADLLRFMVVVDGFDTVTDILQPETIDIMKTPSPVNNRYALGWFVVDGYYLFHDGNFDGTYTGIDAKSNGVCYTFLTNTWTTGSERIWRVMDNVTASITDWPIHDLFDEMYYEYDDDNIKITNFTLTQNYPNPFNQFTTIEFYLLNTIYVKLDIYNSLGQKIKSFVNEELPAGWSSVYWDGTNNGGIPVSSGLYICKMTAGSYTQSKKMVLLK